MGRETETRSEIERNNILMIQCKMFLKNIIIYCQMLENYILIFILTKYDFKNCDNLVFALQKFNYTNTFLFPTIICLNHLSS